MRILVTTLPDIKRIPAQRPQHLLSYLSQENDVTVFSVNAWWLPDQLDPYLSDLLEGVDISYMTDSKINPALQEVHFARKFENLVDKEPYDVYLNVHSLIAGYVASQKMKKRGIPTIFDVADDLPEKIKIAFQIPRLLKPAAFGVGKCLFNKCIAASTRNSLVTETLLRSYAFPPSTSVVVPNGVDLQLFQDSVPCPQQYDLAIDGSFILGFVGVLRREVNLEPVFCAVRDLIESNHKVKMLVVGTGEKLDELKESAQRWAIADSVHFTGGVRTHELPGYISCMNACIISYVLSEDNQNACPLKLFEYMACGKPVISADMRGVREIARDKVMYATSAEEIVQAVHDLYTNPRKATKMGREGKEHIRRDYSWESIGARFERMIREVVSE